MLTKKKLMKKKLRMFNFYQIDELNEKYAKVDDDLLGHVVDGSAELDLVVLEEVVDEALLVVEPVAGRERVIRGRDHRHKQHEHHTQE
jgi:hypothetical protein